MGKLFVNATKNYGTKIEDAIDNSKGRIDGIRYSIADIPLSQVTKLGMNELHKFPEFPLYYLTIHNEYVNYYFNRETIDIPKGKKFTPSEKNNRLICMDEHINFSFLSKLPLSTMQYSINREKIMHMINEFYNNYYEGNYLMTPSFLLNKIGSWEDIMLLDVLKSTSEYLENTPKSEVYLSIVLDPVLLEISDVVNDIKSYVAMYTYITGISLTVINDKSMYMYNKNDYKNILIFIKELKSMGMKIHLNYCGIKDIIFSCLDIERYAVGWFGSFRNFDTDSKRISELEVSSFGRRVRKIFSKHFMSEIPLDYLEVLTSQECREFFNIDKASMDSINFKNLEQHYWTAMLDIIEKDTEIEREYRDNELINARCELLKEMINEAVDNIEVLITKLNKNGRYDDASKLKKNNLIHVKMYEEVLSEFQGKLFF